jgi:hypothetical protein
VGRIGPPTYNNIMVLCTVISRDKYAPLKPVGGESDLSGPADSLSISVLGTISEYSD